MQQLAMNSNNVVEITDLIDVVTGDYVDTATVSVTVKDMQTGVPVEGAVWPVSMPNVGSGRYRAILDAFLVLNKNKQYLLDITASTATELTNWQTPATAVMET